MFTFGIFSTHLPYIAMVAFYAYFLIFGVNQSSKGKIQIAEKSHTVQVHINNSDEIIKADTHCFYDAFTELVASKVLENSKVKQKWKYFGEDDLLPKHFVVSILFSRPPPQLA